MKTIRYPYKIKNLKNLVILFLCLIAVAFSTTAQNEERSVESQKVMLLGHAHMDPVYRWRWNEIENREIYKTFSDVLTMLEKHPELQFSQSYLLYYETVQKRFPALFEKVKKAIAEGRWSVTAGQWVEPDETLPSGESLIRQFLIAHDYYTKNLGIENIDIAWSPDVFTGHPGTLPKIYAGCGIKTYFFSREAPEQKRVFWWESKDGTRILGYKTPGHYNPDFKQLPEHLRNWQEISGYNYPLITFGKGDHGGGPGESDIRAINRLEESTNLKFEQISPEKYFEELHNSDISWPVQKSEFGYQPNGGQWLGCYTSQAKIKKLNRYFENRLITTEKFSAIGTMHKGKPFYPREDFSEAWKILLFNQFHDIIPGTLTGLGVNDAYKDYKKLDQITSELLENGLENIGARINTSEMKGIPFVIYNPHSWQVSQFVEAQICFVKPTPLFKIIDTNKNEIPYAILKESADKTQVKLMFNATEIPGLGYKVFEILEEEPESVKSDLTLEDHQIENKFYRITWDKKGITSIFSKKLNKEILNGTGNKLELQEDNGSAWSMKLTGKSFEIESLKEPEIIYSSSLKTVVKWEDYFQTSRFTRYMTVFPNSEEIEFEMKVDWHGNNKLLQLIFPTSVENGHAFYHQPYGYAERKESKLDYPAQKWIDCSNEDFGVSLLNNGKYGFSINEGVLTMSVVRGSRDMDPRMDEGLHSFKYSLIIHKDDWKDADIPLKALELNQPLIAKQENHHPGEISGWKYSDQSFPWEKSFFSIDSDHVIISSLKTKQDAYDPNPIILRIVETEGRNENVTVNLPYEAFSVIECNHLEQPVEERSKITTKGNRFSFEMGHDQIRTFMIRF